MGIKPQELSGYLPAQTVMIPQDSAYSNYLIAPENSLDLLDFSYRYLIFVAVHVEGPDQNTHHYICCRHYPWYQRTLIAVMFAIVVAVGRLCQSG